MQVLLQCRGLPSALSPTLCPLLRFPSKGTQFSFRDKAEVTQYGAQAEKTA
jgi:hypothetical protein